jgi:hypothetical protein
MQVTNGAWNSSVLGLILNGLLFKKSLSNTVRMAIMASASLHNGLLLWDGCLCQD